MSNSERHLLRALARGYSLAGDPGHPELRRGDHRRALKPATVSRFGERLTLALAGISPAVEG